MLQDTRYMSRLATEYLGLLYGGTIDADHDARVQVSAGRITAYLRDEWGLNAILADGDEDEKNRDDHRHHAVDAAVIALTDAGTVELLSHSAEVAAERGHRLFALDEIKKPWPTFLDDVRRAIDAVNISYRVNRRVTRSTARGNELQQAAQVRDGNGNGKEVEYRHVRKPLQNMSANEVENIVDDTIRKLVQAKLDQIGGEPKKVFADPGNHPYLTAKDGRRIFIHKARIRKPVAVIPLGKTSLAALRRPRQQPSHGNLRRARRTGQREGSGKPDREPLRGHRTCSCRRARHSTRPRPQHDVQVLAGGGRICGNGAPTGGADVSIG